MDNLKPGNRLRNQMLNTQPPLVGRSSRPVPQPELPELMKRINAAMLQAIKDWEAMEERESRGWGPGGEPVKPPKVKGSDILKAEAIMKAMQRMKAAPQRPTGDVSKSS